MVYEIKAFEMGSYPAAIFMITRYDRTVKYKNVKSLSKRPNSKFNMNETLVLMDGSGGSAPVTAQFVEIAASLTHRKCRHWQQVGRITVMTGATDTNHAVRCA